MSVTFACREVVQWLSAVEGHSKHRGISHPLTTVILAMSAIVVASVASHDVIFGRPDRIDEENLEERLLRCNKRQHSSLLLCYHDGNFSTSCARISKACYEMLWSCNTSMILQLLASGPTALTQRLRIGIAIDQLMMWT